MASVLMDGSIKMNDGRILNARDPLTINDYLELAGILPRINPALAPFPGFYRGGGAGFVASGGGGVPQASSLSPGTQVNSQTLHSLYAETTLSDTTPVNPPMTYDGNTVSEIDVPSGRFLISDLYIGLGFVYWTIEVDRGSGFTAIATFGFTLISPPVTEKKEFKSPIAIQGGPGVRMRLKVASAVTPVSPIDVKAAIRCYSDSAPAMRQSTVITLTDLVTTGTGEQVLNMSENGGPPATSIPVAKGSFLEIDDYDVAAGGGPGSFKLEQTNDGKTWFTIGVLEVFGVGTGTSITANPTTPWKIKGDDGPSVAMRLAITTSGGPTPVASVLSGYRG
jgi:hypothetical protein